MHDSFNVFWGLVWCFLGVIIELLSSEVWLFICSRLSADGWREVGPIQRLDRLEQFNPENKIITVYLECI